MWSLSRLFTFCVGSLFACPVKALVAAPQLCRLWSWWTRLVLLSAPSHHLGRLLGTRVKSCCLPVVWKHEHVTCSRRDLLDCIDLKKHRELYEKRKGLTQKLLFGFQPKCRSFYTRAFWLCMVHTLNKRFRGKVMFLVCIAKSSKRRICFLVFRFHLGAFTREHSGCAWSTHWTSAFVWNLSFLFAQR